MRSSYFKEFCQS